MCDFKVFLTCWGFPGGFFVEQCVFFSFEERKLIFKEVCHLQYLETAIVSVVLWIYQEYNS